MKPTTALLLALTLTFSGTAFAQTKGKVRKTKTTPKIEQTPKVDSMNSNEVSSPGAGAPMDSDPITSSPSEPLPPMDNPPARPMDPETARTNDRMHIGLNVGFGSPHVTNFGVNWMSANEMLTAELGFGSFSLTSGDTKVSMSGTDLTLRVHPFRGAFFIGSAIGQQSLSGEGTDNIQSQNIVAKIDIKTTYLSPQLGWMWFKADGGFFMETDIGVQLPLNATASLSTNADATVKADPEYQRLDRDVQDQGKKIGETSLPVAMFKIGWLF